MAEQHIPSVEAEEISEILANASGNDPKNLSLEALVLLINTERLHHLHNKTHKEFKELKDRQDKVAQLHQLLKKINTQTTDNGEFDCTSNKELQQLIAKAKEIGVEIKDGKFKYTKGERDRLVENIRMTVEDLNVMNDMQLQTINRLTNERYESYQMARSILKPLHETKMQMAKGIK